MSKRAAAVALATKGFKVFLLDVNAKTPAIAVVTDKAVSDTKVVYASWSDSFGESRDNNIGISTDELLVLDFDMKLGYDAMNADFERLHAKYKFKHVATSPSGGLHAYLRLPPNTRCASAAKKLGATVDTRSFHGYVVGPGSDIGGSRYSWLVSVPDGFDEPSRIEDILVAPQELIDACGAPAERVAQQVAIEWDQPAALTQAKEYLLNHAPPARQGEGGDEITYKIACKVRDFGVSHDMALIMIDEHWNTAKAEPPWPLEELDKKIGNAYAYAKGNPHVPGSEYDPVEINKSTPATNAHTLPAGCPRFTKQEPFDPAVIPRRQWVVEGVLTKGFVTLINAPPGVGKTQWLAQLMLAMTFGRSDMVSHTVREPVNVWSFNAEDDINELRRRIGAAFIGYGLRWEDQIKQFAVSSGIDDDFRVARWDAAKQRVVKSTDALKAFAKQIVDNDIGAVILDPLADLHEVPESNNDAIKEVVKIFTQLAIATNTAIAIATHSRKQPGASSEGHAGNAESVRGGFSQVAKARTVLTLMPMSQKDAKAAKIDLAQQGSYVRIDSAKGNLGPTDRGAKPRWFKWDGVRLGNGLEDQGDTIGVLRKAELADSRVKREEDDTARIEILAEILAGMPQSPAGVSWAKEVLPAFMDVTGLGERTCKIWFIETDDTMTTELGEIKIVRKAGAGGSVLRFFPTEIETGDDDENERSCYTLDA